MNYVKKTQTCIVLHLALFLLKPGAAFAAVDWDELNGFWTVGSCDAPQYQFYLVDGLYYYVTSDGVMLSRVTEASKLDDKYIVAFWKKKQAESTIAYIWREGDAYKYASARGAPDERFEFDATALPKKPPGNWEFGQAILCDYPKLGLNFIHAEGLGVMRLYESIAKDDCDTNFDICINKVLGYLDISKDDRLSIAEVSRTIRVLAYFGILQSEEALVKNEDLINKVALASLVAPLIASSIVNGSDYDGDGQLSMDEVFFQRDVSELKPAIEKMSFDVFVSSLGGMFQGLSGIMSMLR